MKDILTLLLNIEQRIGNGALASIRTSPFNTLEIKIDWADDFHILTTITDRLLEMSHTELEEWIVYQAKEHRERKDRLNRETTQ